MKLDILAFGAHPDDVELGCGGTLLKSIKEGKKTGVIDLTQGELGTRGSKYTRAQEAEKASEILGISIRENLEFEDGFFEQSYTNKLKIIEKIRYYKPEIVLIPSIKDRHPDHGRASELISDSCFLAGLPKIVTSKLEAFRPKIVLSYIQWQPLKPHIIIDISEYMKAKLEAVSAYKTQFYFFGIQGIQTPISTKNFLNSLTSRAQDLGMIKGVDYAEGFLMTTPPLINSLSDLKS